MIVDVWIGGKANKSNRFEFDFIEQSPIQKCSKLLKLKLNGRINCENREFISSL